MTAEITSIGLIVFLIIKQLCDVGTSKYAQRLGEIITIPILPLLIMVFYIVADKIHEIM